MEIISREEAGLRRPILSPVKIRLPSQHLALHHTVTEALPGARDVRDIQDYHMDVNGWYDIGYSFLVDPVDEVVYEGRGAGIRGAHTAGYNAVAHAIAVIGNFEDDRPSDRLLRLIADLVRHGHDRGWWPESITMGHRDVAATACPGRHLYAKIGQINFYATESEDDEHMGLNDAQNRKLDRIDERVQRIENHIDHFTGELDKIRRTLRDMLTSNHYGVEYDSDRHV